MRTKALKRTMLEKIIELQPQRITVSELHQSMARDPDDCSEQEAIRDVVRELRHDGLVRYRNDDEVIDPTLAASSAFDIFTS